MKKVITYGTYDVLHYGHIRLLERAKELGDYLIVGVTSDDFDKTRGKINVQQSVMERVEAVKATGIADEVIVEEYEGQKIDDIRKYGVDIFTVGSDWVGKFDYLNEYCKVVYLERTQGISSTEIRSEQGKVKIGIIGNTSNVVKFCRECDFVNGIEIVGICTELNDSSLQKRKTHPLSYYPSLIFDVDAVYIASLPNEHYQQIKLALENKKHVLCESPIALSENEFVELKNIAQQYNCVLMDAIKTAYSTAYARLLLLIKGGIIGKVVSVDSTCTSLMDIDMCDLERNQKKWNSICDWGPTAMLPVFQILGTEVKQEQITSLMLDEVKYFDLFSKVDFTFSGAVASIKVAKGVKSEGDLVISGTNGYVYVPAPWWKTDYFEVRYEQSENNKRYFYQLEGEGIRYEIVAFLKSIHSGYISNDISYEVSKAICRVIEKFYDNSNTQI